MFIRGFNLYIISTNTRNGVNATSKPRRRLIILPQRVTNATQKHRRRIIIPPQRVTASTPLALHILSPVVNYSASSKMICFFIRLHGDETLKSSTLWRSIDIMPHVYQGFPPIWLFNGCQNTYLCIFYRSLWIIPLRVKWFELSIHGRDTALWVPVPYRFWFTAIWVRVPYGFRLDQCQWFVGWQGTWQFGLLDVTPTPFLWIFVLSPLMSSFGPAPHFFADAKLGITSCVLGWLILSF